MEDAAQETRLSAFGDAPLEEGLEVLCRALNQEARLNEPGFAAARSELTGIRIQRLKVEDWYRQAPEIQEQSFASPLMVVGLPRSGTSALSQLLAQDPHNRSIRRWEGAEPTPPPDIRTEADDERIKATQDQLDARHAAAPQLMAMNPITVDDPTESLCFLRYCFSSLHFAGIYNVPSYETWALYCDMRPAYRYLVRVLKLLQWRRPPTRWNLKYPLDLFYLDAIAQVIPDARLVWAHRDPVRAVPSVASLLATRRKPFTDHVDKSALGRAEFALRLEQVQRGLRYRDTPGALPIADVYHADLVSEPIGCVQQLYEHLSLEMTESFHDALQRRIAERPKGKFGDHSYTAEEFGLTDTELREAFAGYTGRFRL
jgi:hypothetical protein